MEETPKDDIINELLSIYPHVSLKEMSMLVERCYPDISEVLDLIEWK